MDEDPDGRPTVKGGKYSLVEQMLNKKKVDKSQRDIARLKGIVSEMQMVVTENGVKIDENLITEEQLKIAIELLSNEFTHTLNIKFGASEEKMKQKIKKRLKIENYKEYLKHKVGTEEFYKQIERIDNMI